MSIELKVTLDDKVKYIGNRNKAIMGCIGTVIDTKENNEFPEYKLKIDESLVDFGFEDDYICVIRNKYLQKESEITHE